MGSVQDFCLVWLVVHSILALFCPFTQRLALGKGGCKALLHAQLRPCWLSACMEGTASSAHEAKVHAACTQDRKGMCLQCACGRIVRVPRITYLDEIAWFTQDGNVA
ncbi:hypothetical protein DUNSADRAFT_16147 [Dunaliella salina]|uniref:Secreted protein n=1 Tax=Dunaliella salina TaxID=3046 RepID=A0ABQ7H1E7_DUNSA|nr:hypothetical protein DUNSADRAFT_16147 [Dunaliella salina]|eukprot:KAF5840632.1 hypothetical protein DUNSADRAFT_16147 [Dunaliella salina]